MDLLTDQFDDCRVKIDSLQDLLDVHKPSNKLREKNKQKVEVKSNSKNENLIFHDEILDERQNSSHLEKMRECEYNLEFPNDKFKGGLIAVGTEERIGYLASSEIKCPSSPSMTYREKKCIIKQSFDCPNNTVDCPICCSPDLHSLIATSASILSMLHSYNDRFNSAQSCIEQGKKLLQQYKNLAPKIIKHLVSSIRYDSSCQSDGFILSNISFSEMQLMYYHSEILAINHQWSEAISCNLSALFTIDKISVISQKHHHPFIVLFINQGKDLNKVHKLKTEVKTEVSTKALQSSSELCNSEAKSTKKSSVMTTPKPSLKYESFLDGRNPLLSENKNLNKFNIFEDSETKIDPYHLPVSPDEVFSKKELSVPKAPTKKCNPRTYAPRKKSTKSSSTQEDSKDAIDNLTSNLNKLDICSSDSKTTSKSSRTSKKNSKETTSSTSTSSIRPSSKSNNSSSSSSGVSSTRNSRNKSEKKENILNEPKESTNETKPRQRSARSSKATKDLDNESQPTVSASKKQTKVIRSLRRL